MTRQQLAIVVRIAEKISIDEYAAARRLGYSADQAETIGLDLARDLLSIVLWRR